MQKKIDHYDPPNSTKCEPPRRPIPRRRDKRGGDLMKTGGLRGRWASGASGVLSSAAPLLGAAALIAAGEEPAVLNDDGAWCWFEDERAIVADEMLFVGTIASGHLDVRRRGNVEVTSYDLATGEIRRGVLHENFQADDHNSPALLERPDGRILAAYSRHSDGNRIFYRLSSKPHDISGWRLEEIFVPSESSIVTYSNLHTLSEEGTGRIYNFFRGYDDSYKPSWMFSDDFGETWTAGGILIDFASGENHRPYVKYTGNGQDTLHFLFSEGHPRDYDNSIYHAYYRAGAFYDSHGNPIGELEKAPISPSQATRVFAGDPDNVAWPHDIELDEGGRPYIAYQVQKNSAGKHRGEGGHDHRYRYARWDGDQWHDFEIAYAGSRLYAGEDDYTGGICLHPDDPDVVFISTNVDPMSGRELASGHREVFRGTTDDGGAHWSWEPVTQNSSFDNLRPFVPKWEKGKTALLWLRGTYRSYTDYATEVVLKLF